MINFISNIDEYLLIGYRLIYTACFVKAFTEIGGILFIWNTDKID